MDYEFKSLKELYEKVKPALITKVNDLKRININYIREEDVWNCLKENKWKKSINLSLSELINDILELDSNVLDLYVKNEIKKLEKTPNLEENNNIF